MKNIAALVYPAGIVVLTAIFFWKFIGGGLLPIPSDTIVGLYHPYRDWYAHDYPNGIPFKNSLITDPVRQQYPWREYAIDEIKNGRLPVWNPYQFAGTPHIANLQSAVYYPLNIILFLTPFHLGWSVLVVLQPLLAGIFMYLFLRSHKIVSGASFLGGVIYAYSGFSIAWLEWNTVGHVALWLPLMLLAKNDIVREIGKKRAQKARIFAYLAILIFAGSSCLLAGHLQVAMYVFIASSVYLAARIYGELSLQSAQRRLRYLRRIAVFFSAALASIAAIVSVQFIPFFTFFHNSARPTDQSAWASTAGWFIPWQHLAQFAAPDFFGNPATGNYWGVWNYGELVGYIGVSGLLLSLIAVFFRRDKKTLLFGCMGLTALLFALPTPFAKLPFQMGIPLISTSQPTRLLFIVDFSLSVLAALGLDYIFRQKVGFRNIVRPIAVVGALYGLLWWQVYMMQNRITSQMTSPETALQIAENTRVAMRNLILPTGLFASSAGGLVLLDRFRKYKGLLLYGILFLVCFDLLRFGWKFTPFTSPELLYPQTSTLEFLKNQEGPFRIMSTDDRILPPNFSLVHGIQSVDGYDPLFLSHYAEFAASWVRNRPDITAHSFNRIITPQNYDHPFADMLNVQYVLSLEDIESPKLQKIFQEGQTRVYTNANAFPRAYLVSDVAYADTPQEAISMMYDTSIDLRKTAIVYEDIAISNTALDGRESAEIVSYEGGEVVVQTTSSADRLLVLGDVYYPSWRAYIDGSQAHLYQVNYLFRAVVVPPGTHEVRFVL